MNELHIMSPDEIKALPDGAVVWQEAVDRHEIMPIVMYAGIIGNYREYLYPTELGAEDDIQLRYRYWNQEPSIEHMQSEPWVIREEWEE